MTPTSVQPAAPHWLAVYVRNLPNIGLWSLVCGLVAVGLALVLPSRYTAVAQFISAGTQASQLPASGLAALASRFGIGAAPGGDSPDFYAALLGERTILDPTLRDSFTTEGGEKVRLLDFIYTRSGTPERRLEQAAKKLGDKTTVSVDDQTGIVSLSVEMPDPSVAAQVASRLIACLDSFNLLTRQSEARASRRFIEGRLKGAQHDLTEAEDSLRWFYERNRRLQDSPTLAFEEGRLKRIVDLRQQVFQTLSQEYEQARIDEVRDTPVLTVLQPPLIPTKRSWPKRGLALLFGLLSGFLLRLGLIAWADASARHPSVMQATTDLQSAVNDLSERTLRRLRLARRG